MNNEKVLKKFVDSILIKTETSYFDFKADLPFYFKGLSEKKEDRKIKFCEHIAAFANAEGGFLILGVTPNHRREIIGLSDIENKMQLIKDCVMRYLDIKVDFLKLKELIKTTLDNRIIRYLVIIIPQTKDPIGVVGKDNRYSFPFRLETGKKNLDLKTLEKYKQDVSEMNYDFIKDIPLFNEYIK